MYELFILGQLMDHPMTGYQLRKALVNVVGSELTISFGALYPLLDKLAAAEELTLALATITAAGRTQFWQLVMTPVALNKQTQLTFQIKLNFLHLLSCDQQQVILLDFQQFAQGQVARLTAQHKRVMTNTHMLAADIQDALMVNELQRVRAQAQLDWLDRQLRNGGEVKG